MHALGERYDVVMLTAVWMHLDERQRAHAMPGVASLLRRGGKMIMSLRHGPVPPGRRMFEVSAAETAALAEAHGLAVVLNLRSESVGEQNRRAGITWTRLALVKAADRP